LEPMAVMALAHEAMDRAHLRVLDES